ncbi:MAG: hypothetical protein ABIQ11_01060, partial [Saprospiraceae bacterium]
MMNVQTKKSAIAFSMVLSWIIGSASLMAQPTITVQFAKPQYDCNTLQYCVDVEFKSDTVDQKVFGMN